MLVMSICMSYGQGVLRLNADGTIRGVPDDVLDRMFNVYSNKISNSLQYQTRIKLSDIPWLTFNVTNQILITDEDGNWISADRPSWWPDPAGGFVRLDFTNSYTAPQVYQAAVEFNSTVTYKSDLIVTNLIVHVIQLLNPLDGSIIGPGINATNISEGVLSTDVIPENIVRTTDSTVTNITINGTVTLNDATITSWPSLGTISSEYTIFTIETTNSTPSILYTNTADANTTVFSVVDVMAAGPTNFGNFRLSASTHNREDVYNSITNVLLSQGGDDNISAYWTILDGIAYLNVAGADSRNYNWKANVKLLSVLNATPPPPTFAYLFEENFESFPNENWTLVQGRTNNYNINYTVSPISGSGSLQIFAPTTGTSGDHVILQRDYGQTLDEVWGTMLFSYPNAHHPNDLVLFRVGSANFIIRSTGSPRIEHGSVTVGSTGSSFALSTTYRLWFHYRKSSGSNDGVFRVWRGSSSNTDRSELTVLRETSVGSGTLTSSSLQLRATKSVSSAYASEFIWDDVKIASQEFLTID